MLQRPLRGVFAWPSSFLQLRRCNYARFASPEYGKLVKKILDPDPVILTPAQIAFAYRLGIPTIRLEALRDALSHSLLKPPSESLKAFEEYRDLGAELLRIFAIDYVSARFPKLPKDSFDLAVKVYTGRTNIYMAAKSVGMDYAMIPFTGIPAVKMPTWNEYLRNRGLNANETDGDKEEESREACSVSTSGVYSDIFAAIVGMIHREQGVWRVRKFLDAFLFSGIFNTNLLCRPRNPMLKLAGAMAQLKMPEPDYRLLHETGRLSTCSIYVVGVYAGLEKLAEANGPSLVVAQERAATTALTRLFVVDMPDAPRRSDSVEYLEPQKDLDLPSLRKFLGIEAPRRTTGSDRVSSSASPSPSLSNQA